MRTKVDLLCRQHGSTAVLVKGKDVPSGTEMEWILEPAVVTLADMQAAGITDAEIVAHALASIKILLANSVRQSYQATTADGGKRAVYVGLKNKATLLLEQGLITTAEYQILCK